MGEATAVSALDLDAIAQSTARLVDLAPAQAARLFDSARRLPVARPPGSARIGASAPEPLSRLDRVDAVLACFDAIPLARTAVLLGEARGLLGRVLRDAGPLRRLLEDPNVDPVVCRAAVVAIGLLGETVGLEVAVPNASDADATTAYLLAAVIALGNESYGALARADRRAAGLARMVTDDALRRFDSGDCVCVVG